MENLYIVLDRGKNSTIVWLLQSRNQCDSMKTFFTTTFWATTSQTARGDVALNAFCYITLLQLFPVVVVMISSIIRVMLSSKCIRTQNIWIQDRTTLLQIISKLTKINIGAFMCSIAVGEILTPSARDTLYRIKSYNSMWNQYLTD